MSPLSYHCTTAEYFDLLFNESLHAFDGNSSRHLLQAKGIDVIEIISPGLDTDPVGEGLHDQFPPVEDYIDSIFEQLKNRHCELCLGAGGPLAQGRGTRN